MKKFIYLTLMTALTCFSVSAKRISPDQAISVANAESALRISPPHGMSKSPGVRFSKIAAENDAYYVVTTPSEKGFAIIASDDAMPNLLAGYSLERQLPANPDAMPPQLKAWLHDYSAIVKAVADGRLTLRGANPELKGEAVAPLMKTKWNQDMPFNNFAPLFGSNRAPSGCVATAVTQVMKFFNFPKKGKGQVTAYPYYSDSEKIDLSTHTYDWENMLDVYECEWDYEAQKYLPGNFNDTQATAVATLMRDFGYAVEMSYRANESGAQSSYILPVLVRHFSYSPDACFSYRGNQSEADWNGAIRRSLLAGSPVLYSGSDGKSGHQFVCDGIDENGFLHINWGWGGMSDGYFDMNILSPDNLGIGAGNGAYYQEQDVILNLKPGDESIDNTAYNASLSLSNINCSYRDADGKLNARTSTIFTAQFYNASGSQINPGDLKYFLTLTDMNGKVVYQNREQGQHDINLRPSYYYGSKAFYFDGGIASADIPDGEYKVIPQYAYYADKGAGQLGETRDFSKDREYIPLTVKNGDFYLDKPQPEGEPTIAVTGASAGLIIAGVDMDFSLVVNVKSITDTYQSWAGFSYCLIHENDDTGTIPSSDSNCWRYGSAKLYPGTTIGVTVSAYGPELSKAGRYRMYFRQEDNDITPQEPVWVTAMEAPTEGFILTQPLGTVSLPLSDGMYVGADITPYVPGTSYEGKVQFWAYPESGAPDEAFLVGTREVSLQSNREAWIGASPDVMLEKPLGKYALFLKYQSGDEWKTVPGDTNRGTLDFFDEGMESYLMILTSAAKIGERNEAHPGDALDVEYRLTCRTDLNMVNPQISLLCHDIEHPENFNEWIGNVENLTISSTNIAKGEEFVIKGKLNVSSGLDCGTGKTYVITPAIYDQTDGNNVYYSAVRSYPYGESMKLRVNPLPAEHVDITVNSFETTQTFMPGDETASVLFEANITNNAENPLTHTRINFYPVHVSMETDNPDFEKLPHGSFVPSNFDAGETVNAYIGMSGDMFPQYGVYRIYVTYEDAGRQVIVTGFDPIYVNIPNSQYDVVVESASDTYEKYLEPEVNFNIDLTLSCATSYFGPLELWARPYWGGQEKCILQWNTSVAAGTPAQLQLEASSDAFLNLPFGIYQCYFKVRADGRMVKADGTNNNLTYNVAGISSGAPVLMLTDNAALSSGSVIPQGVETEITLKAYAYGPISLDYSHARIELIDEESGEAINAEGGTLEGPASITQGSFVTLKAKVKLPVDASSEGKMVQILPVLPMADYSFLNLRTYPYEESLRVKQTSSSGVGELAADGSTIMLDGKILKIDNADNDSEIRVHSANGMLCLQREVGAGHTEIGLHALPAGFYVVTLTTGGKTLTSKIILK